MFCLANKRKAPTLEELAANWCTQFKLPALTKCETYLLNDVQIGKPTTLSGNESIRGELIRFLCGNPDAQKLVDPCGIVIKCGRITGEDVSRYDGKALLLSSLKIPFPLILNNCILPSWLLLQGAEIPFLELDGCIVTSIDADVLKIRGDLHMRNKFQSTGNVNLSGVTIGGDLDLSGATLTKDKDPLDPRRRNASLSAEGIHVFGDIRMTDFWVKDSASIACTDTPTQPSTKPQAQTLHFKSTGTICLDGAHIDGDITCDGGCFGEDPTPGAELVDALTLRHASIGGDVLLGRGFVSRGAVRLPGAIVGGDLDCGRGRFLNPWFRDKLASGVALELDGTEIKLDVNLSRGRSRLPVGDAIAITNANGKDAFEANGTVSLVGTRVGRTLNCGTGYFFNSDDDLIPDMPHRWRPALDLGNARVAYLSYFDGPNNPRDVHLKDGQLRLDGFVYDRISRGTKRWRECLKWIEKQAPKNLSDFAPQPYLQLAKVLRDEGDIGGAKNILYEMEKKRAHFLWRANHWSLPHEVLSWCWRVLKRFTIGYGYYSWWALLWLGGICLLGTAIFCCGKAHMVPTDKGAYSAIETPPGGPLPGNYVTFNPFLYSVENTLPIIKLGQTDHWEPAPRPLPRFPIDLTELSVCFSLKFSIPGFLGVVRALQIAAGWFLTTIGVAGLTGLIRKD